MRYWSLVCCLAPQNRHQIPLERMGRGDRRLAGKVSFKPPGLGIRQVAGMLLQQPQRTASGIEVGIDRAAGLHQMIQRNVHDVEAIGDHESRGKVGSGDQPVALGQVHADDTGATFGREIKKIRLEFGRRAPGCNVEDAPLSQVAERRSKPLPRREEVLVDAQHARHPQAQKLAGLQLVHVIVIARDRGVGAPAILRQTAPRDALRVLAIDCRFRASVECW